MYNLISEATIDIRTERTHSNNCNEFMNGKEKVNFINNYFVHVRIDMSKKSDYLKI